jgi:hypothetical protein
MDACAVRGGRGVPSAPFLDVPDEIHGSRLHVRKAAGGDGVSDAEFGHVTRFFIPPEPGEGSNAGMATGDGDALTGLLLRLGRARRNPVQRASGTTPFEALWTASTAWRRLRAS